MKHILFFALLTAFFTTAAAAQAQTIKIIRPPQQLVNFLYKTPDGKENLQKNYQGDLKAAVRDLLVRSVDIDRDRRPEYFVSRKSLCVNSDCTVTLYKQKGRTFVPLFSAPQLDISQGWSEGKRHLISCRTGTGEPPRCAFWRWYKTEYIQYRCVEAESKNSSLKAKEIPCSKIN